MYVHTIFKDNFQVPLCCRTEPLSDTSGLKKVFYYKTIGLDMGVFFSNQTVTEPANLGGQNKDFLLLIDEDAILQGCTLFPFPAYLYAITGKKDITTRYILTFFDAFRRVSMVDTCEKYH